MPLSVRQWIAAVKRQQRAEFHHAATDGTGGYVGSSCHNRRYRIPGVVCDLSQLQHEQRPDLAEHGLIARAKQPEATNLDASNNSAKRPTRGVGQKGGD